MKKITCAHPFHSISRSDLPELIRIAEDRDIGGVAEFAVVSCRAEVEFPSGLSDDVETGCG